LIGCLQKPESLLDKSPKFLRTSPSRRQTALRTQTGESVSVFGFAACGKSTLRTVGAGQPASFVAHGCLSSAIRWLLASLNTMVDLDFSHRGRRVSGFGARRGVGFMNLQAEGGFDVSSVFDGSVVRVAFARVRYGLAGWLAGTHGDDRVTPQPLA
jgi:hypothetical protein